MPQMSFVERYPQPPGVIFAFFRRPANVLAIAPAGMDVQLVEGPEVVSAGSRFVVQVRHFGLTRRIETEVVALEEPTRMAEQQVDGPFHRWRLERSLVEKEGGTELTESIDYEPPGGMLGLILTTATIEKELKHAYEGRVQRVLDRLSAT